MPSDKDHSSKDANARRQHEARESAGETARTGAGAAEQGARSAGDTAQAATTAGRRAAETAADTATRTGERILESTAQTGRTMAEQTSRIADGAARGGRHLAARASRNLEAYVDAQQVVTEGVQSVWREWLNYSQESVQRMGGRMQDLLKARTMQELVETQGEMVRDEIERLMQSSIKISEMAAETATEAARRMTDRIEQRQEQGEDQEEEQDNSGGARRRNKQEGRTAA